MTHNGSVALPCPWGSAEQENMHHTTINAVVALLFLSSNINLRLCSGAFFWLYQRGQRGDALVPHRKKVLWDSVHLQVLCVLPQSKDMQTGDSGRVQPAFQKAARRLQPLLWTSDRSWFRLGDSYFYILVLNSKHIYNDKPPGKEILVEPVPLMDTHSCVCEQRYLQQDHAWERFQIV